MTARIIPITQARRPQLLPRGPFDLTWPLRLWLHHYAYQLRTAARLIGTLRDTLVFAVCLGCACAATQIDDPAPAVVTPQHLTASE